MSSHRGLIQKLIGLLIISLWLVMTFSLLLREGILFTPAVESITYQSIFKGRLPFSEDWMGVYLQNRKVGFVSSIVNPWRRGDVRGLLIRHFIRLLPFPQQKDYPFDIQGYSLLDSDYLLREFCFNLTSKMYLARIHGKRQGNNLHLVMRLNNTEFEEVLPISKAGSILPAPLIFSLPHLKKSKVYTLEFFDPFKMEGARAEIRVKGRERISIGEDMVEAIVAEVSYGKTLINLWMTESGKILKLTASTGWMLIKEDERRAKKEYFER